ISDGSSHWHCSPNWSRPRFQGSDTCLRQRSAIGSHWPAAALKRCQLAGHRRPHLIEAGNAPELPINGTLVADATIDVAIALDDREAVMRVFVAVEGVLA